MYYHSKCRAPSIVFGFLLLLLFSLLFTTSIACSNGNCQVLEPCSAATDCGPGLFCGNCLALGRTQPVCTRGQATVPTAIINDSPFNKYTWIVTHNSFSIVDAPPLPGVQRLTLYNQEDTVTNQLRNGVRALMLDMYEFQNDIWLCHSFKGQCFNFTAFQPAINTLKEDWINIGFLCLRCQKREAEEGIAYQWKYMVENEPGDPGVQPGSCPHRKESKPLNSRSASLFLLNYFPTYPVEADSCKEHSAPLAEMVNTCYKAAGKVLPNFVAVNFYMRSDGGGVFDIVDKMNGPSLCGCSTVTACQAGAPSGSCKNTAIPSTNPVGNASGSFGSFTGSVQFSNSATAAYSPNWMLLLLYFPFILAVFFQLP
ncbi:hypothetical protein K1719_015573 [Acacia pycnantha]|nr:hypothetical protein K1719_015573 [Acacia pycnantha]